MQYVITLPSEPSDPRRFAELIVAEDPGAVLDQVPGAPAIRLSTCLSHGELHGLAGAAGMNIGTESIKLLPSDCCGGCSG
ncbi:hypothetical protein OS187_08800 [Xanthomonadaceae bacterium JHOS43]|nr:hypothetical protein [Xanthomonadaceae bacterium JHOS43]MCX7562508.1 hypothetical protein [Xanthomonadaceae bacterium XH05]